MSDAATASPRRGPCAAAPLPPAQGACAAGGLLEVYYDEGTSYLGYVDEARSVGSASAATSDQDDDDDFDARLHVGPTPAAVPCADGAKEWSKSAAPSARRTGPRRHNVYALRVMPDWAYFFGAMPPISFPPFGAPPVETGADASASMMLPDPGESSAAATPQAAGMPAVPYYDQYLPTEMDGGAAAGPVGVVCCYWKQGYCSMGNSCWYPHEGAADAPCHYGPACRKGHRHLAQRPAASVLAAKDGVPRRYVHEAKPPRPSAPLMDCPEMQCPHCLEAGSVRTQDFPLYEGNRVRQATRGHCNACLRTFMVM